jgi:uncharacterized protein
MGLIYLDSCLLIYLTEQHACWGTVVAKAMQDRPSALFAISPLVKCECLVGPLKRGDPVLEQSYSGLFDCLVTLDMPEDVYLQAARLRVRFNLKTPDALHLACAQHHRCDQLWTNDDRLQRAAHGLVWNILPL